MRGKHSNTLLLVAGAALLIYLASRQTATPLSIYPSLAWMQPASSSMAKNPAQQASPVPLYSVMQQQQQQNLLASCAGSYPGCTTLMSDVQLGL